MKSNFSKIILVLVVPFILGITIAQPSAEVYWEKSYGGSLGDRGESVQQTSDGGYIIAGLTNLVGAGYEPDIFLLKTDADGNELWSRTFGGSEWDGSGYGTGVQQTTDGGYIIGSSTGSFGAGGSDFYLIKTDADGNEVWSKTFGGSRDEIGTSVQQTKDGGYIIAGEKTTGNYDYDFYLVKTNTDGDMEWEKTFGSTGWGHIDRGRFVQQTTDGGYIIVGWTTIAGVEEGDVYLIKTDPDGNELWSRNFGGSDYDIGGSVQQTTDGGYIIAGYTNSFTTGKGGDAYLIKTDPNGNELWSQTFGEAMDNESASSVQQTLDGGYIIAGRRVPQNCIDGWCEYYLCESDAYLIRTDANGNEVWSKTFIGNHRDWASSVQQTSDGGYITAGSIYVEGTCENDETDVYLIYYRESFQNQPPEAICNDVTVPTEPGLCSADASVDDGSFDPDGDEIILEQTPPGPYDLGDTDVTLTVIDDNGLFDTCEAIVTVEDEEAPVISSVSASPNKLWPPNHKMVPVVLAVDATDNCDSVCQIVLVESNEPINGLGDGNTAPDWVITGDLTVKLRAERSGKGNGRVYTIKVECADASENSSTDTATVTVPHDKDKKNNQNNKKKK